MKNSTKTLGILIFFLLFLTNLAVSSTYVLPGNSLSGSFGGWGGTGYFYSPTFNVNAAGGIDITYYDIDVSLFTEANVWSTKGVAEPGVSKQNTMTSIDPEHNSVWCNILNMEIASGTDWNGALISTLGPDLTLGTWDDTRHQGTQDWYRKAIGAKTSGPADGPYYNNESYVLPSSRFPSAPPESASALNRYDFRLRILPTGTNTYTYEMWFRKHKAASNIEGCGYCACGVYNHAINNCGLAAAWRAFKQGVADSVFPISDIDLSSVHVFMGLGNFQDPASHSLKWGRIEVTGTLPSPSEVWVDDNYTPTGLNDGHLWGYDAFDNIQDGINAVSGSTVYVAPGLYPVSQILVNTSVSVLGAGIGSSIINGGGAAIATTGLVRITATGNVTFSGFTVQDAGGPANSGDGADNKTNVGIYAQSSSASATYTISNNKIIGTNNSNDEEDYGFYSNSGKESLVFTSNEVTQTGANAVLLEKHEGAVDVSYNTLDAGVWGIDAIFNMTYGGLDITALHKFSHNAIDLSTGSGTDNAAGVTIASSFGSATNGNGKFTNIQITENTITGLKANRRGITLWNGTVGAGAAGDIANPVITKNTITGLGPATSNCRGIQLINLVSNAVITNNSVSSVNQCFRGFTFAPGTGIATGTQVHQNSFTNATNFEWQGIGVLDAGNNWWGSVDGPKDLIGTQEATYTFCPTTVAAMTNQVAELSGILGTEVIGNVDYCPWTGVSGFDAEIYAGCNDPCDDFCLDFKLSGTNIRFFHFEYPLPTCIVKTGITNTYGSGLVSFQATMFGNVLHIDGNFDPNFTGANVKLGYICFSHNGGCGNSVQTLTCTSQEVRDGDGNLVYVAPGQAIINLDNTAPTKTYPSSITTCYSSPTDSDWACWNLAFHKGSEEWQCKLLQATIWIYKAAGCSPSDLVFTHDFFTTPQPGDFTICYPTNLADRNAIWSALYPTYGDRTYYVKVTVRDSCCNGDSTCDAFTFCTDTHTDNYMTCVDAKPAHNHICLEWNYTPDPVNAVKLRILRSPYRVGNYPEYAASNPVPTGYNDPAWYVVYEGTDTYPCNDATWFNDDGTGCNGVGTFFANATRDIYWYAGFTLDAAGNWSSPNLTVGTGADCATSYWLGDVTDIGGGGGPDGLVYGFTGDVGRLSSAYGTSPPQPGWDNTVDYGPESQEHGIGRGIPTPDDVINWQDLLPFSFNYNIVGPSGSCSTWPLLATNQPPRQLNKTAQPVSVWLEQVAGTQHDGITFALMVSNPEDAIHLFHTQISYNSGTLSLVRVRRGEVGITEGAAEFFASPNTGVGSVDVDLAALGPDAYVVGSGAVAYLDFSYKAAEMPSKIYLKEAILYDGEGNEINLSSTDVEVNQGEAVPTDFALYYNHPNPFNPMTTIKYDLPQASYVKLLVYNVMGQKVATLVDGMVEAGRHQVIWDAKDLSSGIYFYKITAGNFNQMHKMILLK